MATKKTAPKIRSVDWRIVARERLRALLMAAVPGVFETRKWKKPSNPAGVPVFEKDGVLCTLETYKDKVKLTFAKGASLDDPDGVFNASLDGEQRRAIDLFEGDEIDETALKRLLRAAAAFNASRE